MNEIWEWVIAMITILLTVLESWSEGFTGSTLELVARSVA